MTLRAYLDTHGETQAEFARRVGLTQGHVSKLCGLTPRISLSAAGRIERATDGLVPIAIWASREDAHLSKSHAIIEKGAEDAA